jgi:hypothetical protein
LIDIDSHRDSASILIVNKQDYWPPEALPMMDSAQVKKVGIELGWAGYPAIAVPHICLFTGRVAAFISYDDSYLIDGVAINGVSGGPVFCESLTDAFTPEIIGTISSYMSNRQRGDTLPGMLIAHDLTAFHETIKRIRSLDEYRKTKKEEDEKRRQQESAGDIPPTGPTATADPERVVQTDPTEPTKT